MWQERECFYFRCMYVHGMRLSGQVKVRVNLLSLDVMLDKSGFYPVRGAVGKLSLPPILFSFPPKPSSLPYNVV